MRKKTWITCHLSQLDTTKCLVYFLSCLPPHKLWVAWPVEEMSQDRKEIEMGPPGLSGTLEQSPSKLGPQASGDLASMTCWHADSSCKVLGMARVIISIGPISYLGSCNFGKQCIVLSETLPIDLQLAPLPIRELQLIQLNLLGCILFVQCSWTVLPMYLLCLLFQSSARMPRNLDWLPTRRERSKITRFYELCPIQLFGLYVLHT